MYARACSPVTPPFPHVLNGSRVNQGRGGWACREADNASRHVILRCVPACTAWAGRKPQDQVVVVVAARTRITGAPGAGCTTSRTKGSSRPPAALTNQLVSLQPQHVGKSEGGGILLADGHAPPRLLVWTWRRRKLAFETGLMDCLVIPMLADASLCIGRKGCVGWKGKHVEGCWFKQHWYG